MFTSGPPSARPMERRLRLYIEHRAWQRHPVSRARERMGRLALGLLTLSVGLYLFSTRDEGIRRRMVDYLAEATGGEVRVGRARFSMYGGTKLDDVSVAVPFDARLDPSAVDFESREIFSARSLTLVHHPWLLLLGRLRIERIIAAEPTITLTHNIDTGVRNWQLLAAGREDDSGARRGMGFRPQITIRSAKAVVVSVHADGRHEAREERLDADVRPHPQTETAFSIEVRRYSEPAERTTVIFDPGLRLVTNTPFVDARTIRLQLPRAAQQFLDQIALQGEAKLSRLVYDARGPAERDTQLQLRRVRCEIPLAMLRSAPLRETSPAAPATHAGQECAVTMTNVRGRLDLRGDQLAVDVSGLVNGALCAVRGVLTAVDRPVDEIGMDLNIRGGGVEAPQAELRARLLEDPTMPQALRFVLHEYDPRGPFDLDLHLSRSAGPAHGVLVRGSIRPVSAKGRQIDFPYEVDDLHGEVRFDPPLVVVDKLVGRHGPARIQIDATVDERTPVRAVDVLIQGRSVPLDADLCAALPERHRALWELFNLAGMARIDARLTRPGGDEGPNEPPWSKQISADLAGARISFRDFPYALEGVHGRAEIVGERLTAKGLQGRHGDAIVRIDGYAGLDESDPEADLRIEASDMAFDESLAEALPPRGRAILESFSPRGMFDLSLLIHRDSNATELSYGLRARIRDGEITPRDFPCRLSQVTGEITRRPDGLVHLRLDGRHEAAEVSAEGNIRASDGGHVADLTLDCRRIPLSETLRQALPPAMQKLWDILQPRGAVDLRSSIHHVAEADRSAWRHRSEIEASGAAARLAFFPLAMSGLSVRLALRDRRVEILSGRGFAGGGTVEFRGSIDLEEGKVRGTLEIAARGLDFSDELLAAFPESIRESIAAIRPAGRFDLRLDRLRFEATEAGRTSWDFAGQMQVSRLDADLGFALRQASGEVAVRGRVDQAGASELEAVITLDRASAAGWDLRNVRAVLVKPMSEHKLLLNDGVAAVYGGEANVAAEVNFARQHIEYEASITLREMQLGQYLDSTRGEEDKADKQSPARGDVYGNLILRGQTGAGAFREGAGELFVRQAHVWKLPLIFAIFQVLHLTPDENVFHDGWLRFFLSGQTVTFQRIDLQGRAVSFVGGGTMTLPGKKLDVTLLAGSPLRLQVPLLTDILEGASREIMEVHLGGTVDKPNISPRPMRTLTVLLEKLFPRPSQERTNHSIPPAGN